jgi:predicted transcriptional regulator
LPPKVRRAYWEIYAELIEHCSLDAETLTALTTKCNLKHVDAKKYIKQLVEYKLLERIEEEHVKYSSTDKGIRYVERFLELWQMAFDGEDLRKILKRKL